MEIPDDSEICPYCTAHVKKRVRIKSIYVFALILILVSATYAVLAYTSSGVQITKISNLTIDDNYRFVHVRGTVIKYPTAYDSNYGVTQLSFVLSDGSGEITVKIYRDLVDKVVKEHKVPGIGDTVDVEGTFSYGSRKSITVNNVEFLNIYCGTFTPVHIKALAQGSPWDFKNGELVAVEGNITSVREYSFGFISSIDDSVDLIIPHAYTTLGIVDTKLLGSGVVKIYGSLKFYQPKNPSPSYETVNLSKVMKNPESYNKSSIHIPWARVVKQDTKNSAIVVNANGTNVTVYSRHGVAHYSPGDFVEIQGKFTQYNGTWEISVTRSSDFITEPRWEIIMSSKQFEIINKKTYSNTTNPQIYSLVEAKGVVADYRDLSAGYLITLWSNNHTYDVYVESVNSVSGKLDYGERVIVKGMVTLYKGEKEFKVRAFTNDSVEVVS